MTANAVAWAAAAKADAVGECVSSGGQRPRERRDAAATAGGAAATNALRKEAAGRGRREPTAAAADGDVIDGQASRSCQRQLERQHAATAAKAAVAMREPNEPPGAARAVRTPWQPPAAARMANEREEAAGWRRGRRERRPSHRSGSAVECRAQ